MNINILRPAAAVALALLACGMAGAWTPDECDWALATAPERVPVQQPHEEAWDRASFVQYREWCGKTAADARRRLGDEFGVDAGDMSAQQAIARLAEEIEQRRLAQERELQARDERERARYEAEARRQEENAARQMAEADRMAREQNEMLKGLGVDLGGGVDDDEADDVDPTELAMYQKMVDRGVAPHCKGQRGARLIDCVDEALEAEED